MSHPHRRIRSYVLRQGRITKAQQAALDTLWPAFGVDFTPAPLDLTALFGNTRPVTLEIGFGNGESLLQQAVAHPEQNYFGVEVHRPGVGHLLHLAGEAGIRNLRVSNHDAVEVLQQQIPAQSLARVQLFFPDPWHKKRHHKRRILQPDFIADIHRVLAPGGVFHMATDWRDYAEHMQREMDAAPGFRFVGDERGERPLTKFEQRGLRLGHGVWDWLYAKTDG